MLTLAFLSLRDCGLAEAALFSQQVASDTPHISPSGASSYLGRACFSHGTSTWPERNSSELLKPPVKITHRYIHLAEANRREAYINAAGPCTAFVMVVEGKRRVFAEQ